MVVIYIMKTTPRPDLLPPLRGCRQEAGGARKNGTPGRRGDGGGRAHLHTINNPEGAVPPNQGSQPTSMQTRWTVSSHARGEIVANQN